MTELALKRGWDITLLNRRQAGTGGHGYHCCGYTRDEEAVEKAIAGRSYDVVAQFVGYTAEDALQDIRLFTGVTRRGISISAARLLTKASVRLQDYGKRAPGQSILGNIHGRKIEELRMHFWMHTAGPVSRLPL